MQKPGRVTGTPRTSRKRSVSAPPFKKGVGKIGKRSVERGEAKRRRSSKAKERSIKFDISLLKRNIQKLKEEEIKIDKSLTYPERYNELVKLKEEAEAKSNVETNPELKKQYDNQALKYYLEHSKIEQDISPKEDLLTMQSFRIKERIKRSEAKLIRYQHRIDKQKASSPSKEVTDLLVSTNMTKAKQKLQKLKKKYNEQKELIKKVRGDLNEESKKIKKLVDENANPNTILKLKGELHSSYYETEYLITEQDERIDKIFELNSDIKAAEEILAGKKSKKISSKKLSPGAKKLLHNKKAMSEAKKELKKSEEQLKNVTDKIDSLKVQYTEKRIELTKLEKAWNDTPYEEMSTVGFSRDSKRMTQLESDIKTIRTELNQLEEREVIEIGNEFFALKEDIKSAEKSMKTRKAAHKPSNAAAKNLTKVVKEYKEAVVAFIKKQDLAKQETDNNKKQQLLVELKKDTSLKKARAKLDKAIDEIYKDIDIEKIMKDMEKIQKGIDKNNKLIAEKSNKGEDVGTLVAANKKLFEKYKSLRSFDSLLVKFKNIEDATIRKNLSKAEIAKLRLNIIESVKVSGADSDEIKKLLTSIRNQTKEATEIKDNIALIGDSLKELVEIKRMTRRVDGLEMFREQNESRIKTLQSLTKWFALTGVGLIVSLFTFLASNYLKAKRDKADEALSIIKNTLGV